MSRILQQSIFTLGLILVLCCIISSVPALANGDDPFSTIEQKIDGRVGVYAIDLGTNRHVMYRSHERFLMCSTFKLLLVAHILRLVDERKERLTRIIRYSQKDLLSWAPVTSEHVGQGMRIDSLCMAALQHSDNTAANLLLASQGGPSGLTHFIRSIGDKITRVDRIEPFLNTPEHGKDFDTTTPEAMVMSIRKIFFDNILSESSRKLLKSWLFENKTGDHRLKAGVPPSWRVADKTGSGDGGIANDIGLLYPPNASPIIVAAYVSGAKSQQSGDAALADIARQVVEVFENVSRH